MQNIGRHLISRANIAKSLGILLEGIILGNCKLIIPDVMSTRGQTNIYIYKILMRLYLHALVTPTRSFETGRLPSIS